MSFKDKKKPIFKELKIILFLQKKVTANLV